MDAIIEQVTALAQNADKGTRRSMIDALRTLSYSIETPDDTVTRLWRKVVLPSCVSEFHSYIHKHLEYAATRTAIDLKLFKILADSKSPVSVTKLAEITGAASILLKRLCRYLAALSQVKETGVDEFAANEITKTLVVPGNEACIVHYFDVLGPVFQATPAYLSKTGYREITNANECVWQDAHHCKENVFEWFPSHPVEFQNFNLYMAARRQAKLLHWIAGPLTRRERAVFVDVGGNIGHQCAEFKAKHADTPGRVILQDLPFAVEHAFQTPGVENLAHDFLTPQPITGAKYYYLRAIFHDWPDQVAQVILKHLIDAMAPDSQILIDDIVLPSKRVNWQVSQIDLTMMTASASMERTETQWKSLFDSVDLKVVERVLHMPGMYETISVVIKQ